MTATPIVPLTDPAVLDKLGDWMRAEQRSGKITQAYGLVGGGCSVMEVATAEELHEETPLCPVGAYLSFDFKPLIDLDASLGMGRDQLPG